MKGYVVDIDPTGTVLTYVFQETIVADSDGVGGRGRGEAVLTLIGDGFLLETSSQGLLNFP